MELTLVERLRAFAFAEARHGIGRQRKDLFNEAATRVEKLEALRDNQQFMMEWIENHFPQVMDEAEHALAEWDGKP